MANIFVEFIPPTTTELLRVATEQLRKQMPLREDIEFAFPSLLQRAQYALNEDKVVVVETQKDPITPDNL